MRYYVGLDVSMESTAVCVLDEAGGVILERSVPSDPDAIALCMEGAAGELVRVGLEAGPLSP